MHEKIKIAKTINYYDMPTDIQKAFSSVERGSRNYIQWYCLVFMDKKEEYTEEIYDNIIKVNNWLLEIGLTKDDMILIYCG